MWRRVAAAALVSTAWFHAEDAAAHQRLIRAVPANDTVIARPPAQLTLVFQEPVELAFTRVEVLVDGVPLAPAELRLGAPTELIAHLDGAAGAGRYTVRWSTASRDGHPVRGEYAFIVTGSASPGADASGEPAAAVAAPGRSAPPAEHHTAASADAFDAGSPAYVLVRWLGFVSLVGVIGAALFGRFLVGRRRVSAILGTMQDDVKASAARTGILFAVALAIAGGARLWAQSVAMHGSSDALDPARLGTLLSNTVWGWGWLLQMFGVAVAAGGFLLVLRHRGGGWMVAIAGCLLLAATPALSGHAVAMEGGSAIVAIVNDAVHVFAAGGWLGTLLLLLLVGVRKAPSAYNSDGPQMVVALVSGFTPLALAFAGLLVFSGAVSVILHSGSLAALLDSRYGILLGVKLVLFGLVLAAGAYNYLRVRPALLEQGGPGRLRRAARAELGFGAAVLLVTALLVATARPAEEHVRESLSTNEANHEY